MRKKSAEKYSNQKWIGHSTSQGNFRGIITLLCRKPPVVAHRHHHKTLERMLPGHEGQHVPSCLDGFLQCTTHRTFDSVTTPSWKQKSMSKVSQRPIISSSLLENNWGGKKCEKPSKASESLVSSASKDSPGLPIKLFKSVCQSCPFLDCFSILALSLSPVPPLQSCRYQLLAFCQQLTASSCLFKTAFHFNTCCIFHHRSYIIILPVTKHEAE